MENNLQFFGRNNLILDLKKKIKVVSFDENKKDKSENADVDVKQFVQELKKEKSGKVKEFGHSEI